MQQPSIRFLPLPYPATTSVEQWVKQTKEMVAKKLMVGKHGKHVLNQNLCTARNFHDCRTLASRLGWRTAFLEDPLLEGLLAARASKGQSARIQQAVIAEAKTELTKLDTKKDREEAVRQLIGPQGGVPTLKNDLLRLGTLLRLDLDPNLKVEELKSRIRPMIDVLKGSSTTGAKATSSGARPKASPNGPRTSAASSNPEPAVPAGLTQEHVRE